MTKVYYKGNEVLDVTTYDQIDRYTVEIDIDVLLKNGDMRTISIKNPLGRKKWDKGYMARRIGIETGIYECQETIEGYFNEEYFITYPARLHERIFAGFSTKKKYFISIKKSISIRK